MASRSGRSEDDGKKMGEKIGKAGPGITRETPDQGGPTGPGGYHESYGSPSDEKVQTHRGQGVVRVMKGQHDDGHEGPKQLDTGGCHPRNKCTSY